MIFRQMLCFVVLALCMHVSLGFNIFVDNGYQKIIVDYASNDYDELVFRLDNEVTQLSYNFYQVDRENYYSNPSCEDDRGNMFDNVGQINTGLVIVSPTFRIDKEDITPYKDDNNHAYYCTRGGSFRVVLELRNYPDFERTPTAAPSASPTEAPTDTKSPTTPPAVPGKGATAAPTPLDTRDTHDKQSDDHTLLYALGGGASGLSLGVLFLLSRRRKNAQDPQLKLAKSSFDIAISKPTSPSSAEERMHATLMNDKAKPVYLTDPADFDWGDDEDEETLRNITY